MPRIAVGVVTHAAVCVGAVGGIASSSDLNTRFEQRGSVHAVGTETTVAAWLGHTLVLRIGFVHGHSRKLVTDRPPRQASKPPSRAGEAIAGTVCASAGVRPVGPYATARDTAPLGPDPVRENNEGWPDSSWNPANGRTTLGVGLRWEHRRTPVARTPDPFGET
jgi:hypothetical protein